MATIRFFVLRTHFSYVGEPVHRTMFTSYLISVYGFLLKVFWFIAKYVYRSERENGSSFKANLSQSDDQVVPKNFKVLETTRLAEKRNLEGSVSMQSAIVANTSKYQFISGKNVSEFMEEAKTMKFDMFVGSNEGFVCTNQCLDSEFSRKGDSLEVDSQENLKQLEEGIQEENGSNEDFDCTNQRLDSEFSQGRDSSEVNFQENLQQLDEELQEEKGSNESFVYDQCNDSEFARKGDSLEVDSQANLKQLEEGIQEENGSNEDFDCTNERFDSEFSQRRDSAEVNFQENLHQLDEELQEEKGSNEGFVYDQGNDSEFSRKGDSLEVNSQENLQQIYEEIQENGKVDSAEYENHSDEGLVSMEVESTEDQDFAYEIVLLPQNQFSTSEVSQDSEDYGNENELLPRNELSVPEIKQDSEDLGNKFLKVVEPDNKHDPRIAEDIGKNETAEKWGIDNEYIELEPPMVNSKDIVKENLYKIEESHEVESDIMAFVDNSQEEASNSRSWDSDSEEEEEEEEDDDDDDDDDECDILLEHQHLVQQMKMGLKNYRVGLPTISEECETPKMVEDLKPLKIDDKFEYKDVMEEIQKFYKSYKERMRKLDILNDQTLHAISFLQLKDSEVFTSVKKKSALTLRPTWPMKLPRVYVDPTRKLIVEMHRDLELVYVGQLCLSWEILCWQYAKAKELIEYDAQGFHSYNRVAEEFQQFQVLVQRFIEDEQFQGPRIQNYVKNRCLIRSLLQVPIIKDDCLKDKKEIREETDTISLELLTEIIRISMLIFWEFLHADKCTKTIVLKGVQGAKIDLREPTDSELIIDIITNLQKKERRLKEIARSRNCIVKKFQKHQECQLNNALFTSRVELRLVSEVLSLSRITMDQLLWCQKKLNNINFASRKILLEPSFSLFPS